MYDPTAMKMAATRRLTAEEWEASAVPARDRVFAKLDPYGASFTATSTIRRVVFPVAYCFDRAQWAVIKAAGTAVGDDGIFLQSLTERELHHPYWWISFDDVKLDMSIDEVILENAIFSPSGRWGALFSDMDHAVVGGEASFMTALEPFPCTEAEFRHVFAGSEVWSPKSGDIAANVEAVVSRGEPIPLRRLKTSEEQAQAFVEFWRVFRDRRGVGEWVPSLIEHLYGATSAKRILAAAGWS
jgi:hypothetical protein